MDGSYGLRLSPAITGTQGGQAACDRGVSQWCIREDGEYSHALVVTLLSQSSCLAVDVDDFFE